MERLVARDGPRCCLRQLKLGTDLLDPGFLLLHPRDDGLHFLLQLLDLPVLFEEFIEQHRVYLIVAHCVGLAFFVRDYESRIDFLNIFSNQAKLRRRCGIKFLLVAKADRFQRVERFASLYSSV